MNFTEQFVSLRTLVRKEVSRVTRIWMQTIVPPIITMSLYFIIFGNLIGRRIGQMEGFDYMQYIAPGLIMMAVITNSYGNVVSSFYGAKYQRHLEEMLVAPMPTWVIILGHVSGGVMRGLMVGAIVTVVTLFFTEVRVANIYVTVSVVILTSAVFAMGGLINAIFASKFDDITIIPAFVLAPLTYLGGVFYSISMLPPLAQKFSLLNPILYMVNAFRHGMLGVSDIDIVRAYIIIVGFFIGLFLVCMVLINKGIGIRE
jgi:ABC-2 type transport system permease protein